MIIPSTYGAALFLILLSMICWGSWANTFKLTPNWRFELFYYDYSAGVLLAAIIAALTFGMMGSELSFVDNFSIAGTRKMAFGLAAGVIFNLANMLLVGAISIAGMAVAFPVGIGLALVVGVIWNYILNPQGNPTLLGGGVLLVLVAIIVDAVAYSMHARAQKRASVQMQAELQPQTPARAAARTGKRKSSSAKGLIISLISGLLMGSFYPLIELGKSGGVEGGGLGPYSIAVVFAVGVFFSTFVFNLYFLNLPLSGPPVEMTAYFRGTARQHLLGIAGGMIWCVGAISNFVAASTPKEAQVGPAVSYAVGQGATMVSALWGLLVWREFAGANSRVRLLIAIMLVLFMIGLVLVSMAPLYATA